MTREHGRAPLAGRPERGPQDPVGREVEVRVLEHDDGVLAAELEAQSLELAAGPLRDRPARLGAARERDDADVRVVDDRVADLAARTGHEVDDARREARLVHELDEERRAVGRVARRLEHDGVAGDERRHRSSSTGSPSGSSRA